MAADLVTQKGSALVYYLASRPGQTLARSHLVALLWEESDEREGRNSLSTALSRLRRSLPDLPIAAVGDALAWRPESPESVWVDTASLRALAEPDAPLERLEEAVGLWRGPFLESFDLRDSSAWEEWLQLERAALQRTVLGALERAVELRAAAGDVQAALAHARRALGIDPLQERFHRHVMRLHDQAGERATALAHFQSLVELLQAELGVEPDPETRRLYDAIAGGSDDARARRGRPAAGQAARTVATRAPQPQPAIRLVARQVELRALLEGAERAAQGASGFALVQGEAGIGKSRLAEELLWTLDGAPARDLGAGPPWVVLIGGCHESEQGLPYRPFVDVLSAAVGCVAVEQLGLGELWLAEVARLVPELVELLPGLPTPARLDPQQEQRRLFEGVARLLGALPAPRVVVLEDLHWADESSLRLLGYLVRHPALQSTFIVATARSEELTEPLIALVRELEREHRITQVRLERLDPDATLQLLRELVREEVHVLGQALHEETEGNPLFAVETVRSLLEAGQIHLGTAPGPGAAHLPALRLPESVQAVIHARLARLPTPARDFANAAAVLGAAVDFDHARAVAGQEEPEALDALERLVTAQLMREVPGAPGEALYAFSHDKIRQVVYDDLSSARRRVLHRHALETLSRPAVHVPPERLAYHATRAQDWERALQWSEAAAQEAMAVFAYAAAAALYEQALASLQRLPTAPELRAHSVGIRLRLAHVALFADPTRLAEWLQPAEAEAEAAGDPGLLLQVWLAQATALYIQGNFTYALPLLDRVRPAAEASGNPLLRAQYASLLGQVLAIRGEYERALSALEEALAILPPRSLEGMVVIEMLAATHAYRGEFDAAMGLLEQHYSQAESLEDQATLAASHVFVEAVYQMRGDWARARASGLDAIARARAAGNVLHEYLGHVFLGLPEARLGDPESGAATLRRAIAIAEQAGMQVLLGRANGWLAEVEVQAGHPAEALVAASRGREVAQTYGYLFDAALCERARGEALLALEDAAGAETSVRQALGAFESLAAWPEVARTRLVLAQVLGRAGRQAERRAEEAAGAALLTALGMGDRAPAEG